MSTILQALRLLSQPKPIFVGPHRPCSHDIFFLVFSWSRYLFISNSGVVFLFGVFTFLPKHQLNPWHIVYENLPPVTCTSCIIRVAHRMISAK